MSCHLSRLSGSEIGWVTRSVSNNQHEGNQESSLSTENGECLEEPKMYRVLLHNDHYTTMDFVVAVLMKIFHKSVTEATMIMLDVHRKGMGVCGVYVYDIAVTKVAQVEKMAKDSGHPLKCSYEEA